MSTCSKKEEAEGVVEDDLKVQKDGAKDKGNEPKYFGDGAATQRKEE